jgi:hypothetical protein
MISYNHCKISLTSLTTNFDLRGDFNFISSLEEKKGGIHRLDHNNVTFNTFIQNQTLVDIETINVCTLGTI